MRPEISHTNGDGEVVRRWLGWEWEKYRKIHGEKQCENFFAAWAFIIGTKSVSQFTHSDSWVLNDFVKENGDDGAPATSSQTIKDIDVDNVNSARWVEWEMSINKISNWIRTMSNVHWFIERENDDGAATSPTPSSQHHRWLYSKYVHLQRALSLLLLL